MTLLVKEKINNNSVILVGTTPDDVRVYLDPEREVIHLDDYTIDNLSTISLNDYKSLMSMSDEVTRAMSNHTQGDTSAIINFNQAMKSFKKDSLKSLFLITFRIVNKSKYPDSPEKREVLVAGTSKEKAKRMAIYLLASEKDDDALYHAVSVVDKDAYDFN